MTKELSNLISYFCEEHSFNGAVLVAQGGVEIHKQGYGLANIEWEIPNQPDTVFRIGSLTKQFTAMLVLQLVERGQLFLDGKVSEYLPWYRQDTGQLVSIHNLLTHTSGVPTFTTQEFVREHLRIQLPVQDFIQRFCSGDLEFSPGTEFRYSNSGYHILGAIIEAVTGKPYHQVLEQQILRPLSMEDSGFDFPETIVPRRATGYEWDGQNLSNASFVDMSIPYAGGGMYSTVEDLFLWDMALKYCRLLSPALTQVMFTPIHGNYACGWDVARVPWEELGLYLKDPVEYQGKGGEIVHRHEGAINGFHSLILRQPDLGRLVVLLSNRGEAPLAELAGIILEKLEEG